MISVIIATRDDEFALAKALSALVPAVLEGVVREALIVDGGSSDGTLRVADAAGCTIVPSQPAGEDSLRRAADLARADWLLFLSPVAMLETDWQREVLDFIDRALVAGEARGRAAAFRLGRVDAGWRPRLAEWIAFLCSRVLAAPREEQGLLISRTLYREIGGHRAMPAMAGIDLARRIGRRRLTVLRSRAWVREGRGIRSGGLRRSVKNGACLALFVLRMPPHLIGRLAA